MASRLNGRSKFFLEDGVPRKQPAPRPVENLKGGPKRYVSNRKSRVTVTCSFTLTKELDLMIEELAT